MGAGERGSRGAGEKGDDFTHQQTDDTAGSDVAAATGPAARIIGFDIARALAILGMLVVHGCYVLATDDGAGSQPGWLTAILRLLDGRATAMFVILAGMGLTLMCRRAVADRDPQAIRRSKQVLRRRGVFLLVLGYLILRYWTGDILRVYGITLLVVPGMIAASHRRLWLAAALCVIAFVVMFFAVDFDHNWDWETLTYNNLWTAQGAVRNLFFDGVRSVFPWAAFVFLGMSLGRLNFYQSTISRRVLLAAAAVGISAELLSRAIVWYLQAHPHGMEPETIDSLFGTHSLPALPLFLLASGGEAVALITACVGISRLGPAWLWQPLVATGQLALTWYSLHLLVGVPAAVEFGWASSLTLPAATECAIALFALAVLGSSLWKMFFRHGPLEWVMRKVAG